MERRQFIQVTGAGAFASSWLADHILGVDNLNIMQDGKSLTAQRLHNYLRSLYPVDEPSVDRIIIGDPKTEVSKLGTAWMPTWAILREAVARGVNTMVVHEPAFYTHWDLDVRENDYLVAPEPAREAYIKLRDNKQQWILENKLVLIRCHDVLDAISGFGIPYALGRFLGFQEEDKINARPYYHVYRTEPKPAIQAAKHIAKRLKKLGQPGVAFYGDGERVISKVGVGTGCACDPMRFMEQNPDLVITIDDTVRTWIQTIYSEDSGMPLVVINHGTSEEPGVQLLHAHLQKVLPSHDVIHFKQGCGYRWISV